MRVALVSAHVINNDVCYNLSQIIKYMQLARDRNANLVALEKPSFKGLIL